MKLNLLPNKENRITDSVFSGLTGRLEDIDQSSHLSEHIRSLHLFIERAYPGSLIRHHGYRTPRCGLVFHGLGQLPEQTAPLANSLFERGWNVLCLPAPSGFSGKQKSPNFPLSETLAHYCRKSTEFASLFGDEIASFGFSKGGVHALRSAIESPLVRHCYLV